MGLACSEWAAFIAKETNATTPFCLFPSNNVDQKEVALRVALHERSKCPRHVFPSNDSNLRERDPSFWQAFAFFFKILLEQWFKIAARCRPTSKTKTSVWIKALYSLTVWFTVATNTATIYVLQHAEQVSHLIQSILPILHVDCTVLLTFSSMKMGSCFNHCLNRTPRNCRLHPPTFKEMWLNVCNSYHSETSEVSARALTMQQQHGYYFATLSRHSSCILILCALTCMWCSLKLFRNSIKILSSIWNSQVQNY